MKRGLVNKVIYYRDAPLLIEIWAMQRRISRGGGERALSMLESTPVSRGRRTVARDAKKIDHYVNLGLRIGGFAGAVDSCLTRSVIRAVLLRRSGVDARVAFGLNKSGERLDGHCWVVLPNDKQHARIAQQYQSVDVIPGGDHE
jgi:hypothetical protein